MNKTMTITEIAEILGISPRTIERWEKTRKVKKAKRDYRGYRVYDQNDLEKLILTFHIVKAFSLNSESESNNHLYLN